VSTATVIYNLVGRDSASSAFNKVGSSAGRLEKTVGRLGKAVAVAGAAVVGSAAAIAGESIKAAVSFQASMEKIKTQAGASQKDVDSLTKSVLKMAPATEQGPQQLSEALYHLKSIGLDNADAMNALKTASDLAAVGGANLEDTTNALGGAWRSGIKGAQSFGQTAATVNAIIGAGNMRMEDFTAAIGTGILPAAKTFGVSLQSMGAALALMTDEGVPAEDAATRLKMSLSLLGAPSMQAQKQLKTIGLTGLQLADAMRGPQGLIGAISLLKSHLDASGLSASQQAALLSRAFGGGRSSSAILTMINNLDVLRKKQDQINTTTGRYGGAVAAQRKTAQAQFDLLKSSLDTLGIRLGLDLLPPVTKFTHWLSTTGITEVSKFTTKVRSIIPVSAIEQDVKKAEQWVKNLFGMGGEKAPKITPRIDLSNEGLFTKTATLKVKPQVDIQNEGLFTHTPVLKTTPQIDLQNEGIFTKTAPAASKNAGKSIGAMLKNVDWGSIVADAIDSAVSAAGKIGAAFGKLLGKINWLQVGKEAAFVLVPLAVGLVNNLVTALIMETIHHPLDMLLFVASLFPIGKLADAAIWIFKDIPLIGPIVEALLKPLSKAGDLVGKGFGKILKKIFGPVGDRIGAAVGDARNWLLGKGEEALLGMARGLGIGWRFAVRWLGKLGDLVTAPFAKAGSWLLGKGRDILDGLLSGLRWVWNKGVSPWLGKIGGWIGGLFSKAGSWLAKAGQWIIDGLLNGLRWVWNKALWPWLGKIGGWVTGLFSKAGSWLSRAGQWIIDGLLNGLRWVWNKALWPWLGRIPGWIGGLFSKAGSWLWNHGWDLIQGLYNGIKNRIKNVGSWVKNNIVNPFIKWIKHHFGIKSPSTVMHGIGVQMIAGFLRGILMSDPLDSLKSIFGGLPQALGGMIEHGLISAAKLPGKAISALKSLGSTALSAIGSALSGVKGLGSDVLGLFGLGGGGGGYSAVPAKSGSAAAAQRFAAAHLAQFGWGQNQMASLIPLWNQESGWNANAVNPSSGAYGIPQSLGHGHPYNLGDYANQVLWGLSYIKGRYGSPAAAWAHEEAFNWYAKGLPGQIFSTPTLIGVGDGTRPEKVTVTPLGANYGGGDGAAAPLIGTVNISPQEGPTVDEAMGALLFTMRRARQAGFPRR
jgi:TP901 family phage tail tape measure protein